jgi:hypothetical protein
VRSTQHCSRAPKEVADLEQHVTDDLLEYCRLAKDLGLHTETKTAGPDIVIELRRLCLGRRISSLGILCGQLVFRDEVDGFLGRFLHNHTALELLRWLRLRGPSVVILPVRVSLRTEQIGACSR